MKKVLLFSALLILGLILSQFLVLFSPTSRQIIQLVIKNLTLVFLAFIMIHVGIEFTIDRSNLKQYVWDYIVASTAATLPWIFCSLYFVYVLQNGVTIPRIDVWTNALLLSRFASPTATGLLFAMLTAACLENTWMFKKIRLLVIFDDLDTIILLIPIKMMILGFKWETFGLLGVIGLLLYLAWKKLHSMIWPINWYWILIYSLGLTIICEGIYYLTKYPISITPIQIEVLLPAFVLGCILTYRGKMRTPHRFFQQYSEKTVQTWIRATFIFLVGLSMPIIEFTYTKTSTNFCVSDCFKTQIGTFSLWCVLLHVLAITVLANLGKMFPIFCYRKEATLKERLALSLGMWPRGEVGAGVIILALELLTDINQTLIIIATLSLALNLILTGPLIMIIKKLLSSKPKTPTPIAPIVK